MQRSALWLLIVTLSGCTGEVGSNQFPKSDDATTAADAGTSHDSATVPSDAGRDAAGRDAAVPQCADGDGVCPPSCDAAADDDCSDSCGDGVVDELETCDGDCPSCDDGDACTVDEQSGTPENCNVVCASVEITACVDSDGCCPAGCLESADNDCRPVCGNGVPEGPEICDGDCPTTCDDNEACTTDTLTGSAETCDAVCTSVAIVSCVSGDGCCAPNCNELNDDDCAPVCGNGVVETGETCDGACPDCNDQVACTTDTMSGDPSTCDVMCTNTAITLCIDADGCCAPGCDATNDTDCAAICGNGVIEGGELCDPIADCPTSCDDQNACTMDALSGAAQTCDSACSYIPITACVDADGCCPAGCNANTDDDCAPSCGNSVVESGETCDPVADCPVPADCDDGKACTTDSYSGDAAQCNAACSNAPITACIDGDGCCPPTCTNANDDDCPLVIDCRDPSTWPQGWADLEAAIFAETNAQRTQQQTCNQTSYPAAPALVLHPGLQEAARCHAFDMATNDFFSHTGTGQTSVGGRASGVGYNWNAIAENIAAGGSTAVGIVNQWMTSTSGHCEAIMNPTYEDLGVGYAYDSGSTWKHYSVQVFGRD